LSSVQAYEAVAREARRLASGIAGYSRGVLRFQGDVSNVIGGTATGEDRMMVGLIVTASGQLREAERALQEAVAAAQAAAREAQAEEERRAREAERSR